MSERRKIGVPVSKEQRLAERRDSPRVPMRFLVRDVVEGSHYFEREGDLSLGGIYWRGSDPRLGTQVEVRFRLPGVPKEVRARAEIIRVLEQEPNLGFHFRFVELDVADELAMARHIDNFPPSRG